MNAPTDSDFRKAYQVFGRDHLPRRADLLARLSCVEALPAASWRWRAVRTPIGLAASLLVVVLALVYFTLSNTPRVYGIEGLRERLLAIHSLHVKGWLYQRTQTEFGEATLRFPHEEFYERPYRRYHTTYGFSFASGESLSDVTRAVIVGDDQKSMLLSHKNKQAIVGGGEPLQAQLMVETQLQSSIAERILCGLPEEFSQVGTEKIGGVMCDVYESPIVEDNVFPFRTRLWLNPENGMPVKWIAYRIDADHDELPFCAWNEIHINTAPPDGMFDYKAPEGYELIEAPATTQRALVQPLGSGAAFDDWAASWIGLNIDDRAVLVCWSQRSEVDGENRWFELPVTFSLLSMMGSKSRACDELTLHTHDDGQTHWRWSLVSPRDKKPIGAAMLSGDCKARRGSVGISVQPLRFGPTKLPRMVVDVQRATMPADADDGDVTTLEEIRKKLAK